MYELITYIRKLLAGSDALGVDPDSVLLPLFLNAGADRVDVGVLGGRAAAGYPRIVLEGDEGEQIPFSDNTLPKFFNGRLKLQIVTRESASSPEPLTLLYQIKDRCNDLLLGNPTLSPVLPGVKGQKLPGMDGTPKWSVTEFHQVRPTRLIPVIDPVFRRHETTFAVQLNRLGF